MSTMHSKAVVCLRKCGSHLKNNERGSSTIEASLIFPAIFITLLIFLCVSLVVYQKVITFYTSAQAAERLAYTWNNSHKHVQDGSFPFHEHDHLYWRLTDDRLLDILFNRDSSTYASVSSTQSESNGLAEEKMLRITESYPNAMQGRFFYQNNIYERKVQVETQNPINVPQVIQGWFGDTVRATYESGVVDPVEFIRTIDLVRQYKERLQNREKVNQVLDQQKDK